MLCADVVEVWWDDPAGHGRMVGLLEDISPSGACLQLDIPAPLGTEIHWKSGRREFAGTVRYCVYREIGYFVGVEFTGGAKWSKQIFRPRHLLDLQRFLR